MSNDIDLSNATYVKVHDTVYDSKVMQGLNEHNFVNIGNVLLVYHFLSF